ADKFVRLSMSATVMSPVGLDSAVLMAACSSGSGMLTTWAAPLRAKPTEAAARRQETRLTQGGKRGRFLVSETCGLSLFIRFLIEMRLQFSVVNHSWTSGCVRCSAAS